MYPIWSPEPLRSDPLSTEPVLIPEHCRVWLKHKTKQRISNPTTEYYQRHKVLQGQDSSNACGRPPGTSRVEFPSGGFKASSLQTEPLRFPGSQSPPPYTSLLPQVFLSLSPGLCVLPSTTKLPLPTAISVLSLKSPPHLPPVLPDASPVLLSPNLT